MEEGKSLQLSSEFHRYLAEIGAGPKLRVALMKSEWTLPMVRDARDIAQIHGVRMGHIVRLKNMGMTLDIISELIPFRNERDGFTIPLLYRCWQFCGESGTRECDREFFSYFLEAVDDLILVASEVMRSAVTRSPSFLVGRLLEYAEITGYTAERVYQELTADPQALLERILEMSMRGRDRGSTARWFIAQPEGYPQNPFDTDDDGGENG